MTGMDFNKQRRLELLVDLEKAIMEMDNETLDQVINFAHLCMQVNRSVYAVAMLKGIQHASDLQTARATAAQVSQYLDGADHILSLEPLQPAPASR